MVGSGNAKSARMIAVASANSPAANQTTRVRTWWRLRRVAAAISDVRGRISVINSDPPAHMILVTAAESAEVTHRRPRAGN
jgi:hypothetical protein